VIKDCILEFENVSKYYGDELVFNNVNLKVKKGEVISIVGKSGSGKSTLLKCINRLENIDNGKIKFKGMDISEMSPVELRQKIGIVFQDYNLFEHLTVLDNLIIGLIKIKGYSKKESIYKALNILKKVDLIDKKDNYPDELSGGQKQRVAIARTLLMKPDIILLDEPTSALDKEMKNSVLKLINELIDEDMTLIVVSHEDEFVNKVSDRIFSFNKNTLLEKKNE
jgi:AMINO ACID PERMEASE ATP-BINDING PROTEIN